MNVVRISEKIHVRLKEIDQSLYLIDTLTQFNTTNSLYTARLIFKSTGSGSAISAAAMTSARFDGSSQIIRNGQDSWYQDSISKSC